MAIAPPRPCPHPGCPSLNCQLHAVPAWRTRRDVTGQLNSRADRSRDVTGQVKRVRGRELQRRRKALFARNPWCVLCLEEGKHTRATIRDHLLPLAEGGTEDERNIQGICDDHNQEKTRRESERGVRRSR